MDDLTYAGTETVTKVITVFHALKIEGEIADKKLDEKFSLLGSDEEKEHIDFYSQYFKEEKRTKLKGAQFIYKFDSPNLEMMPEAHDRFRALSIAIRLLKKRSCDTNIHFSYNDSVSPVQYHKPFFLFKFESDYTYLPDGPVIINNDDFEKIKYLYKEILKLDLNRLDNFSRLKNAVEFFVHGNNENWFVLKIALFFIALESLFSDDKNEISYKIALRTAHFLSPQVKEQRIKFFSQLRSGYKIRSNFVHGSNINMTKMAKELNQDESDVYTLYKDYPKELGLMVGEALLKILTNKDLISIFTTRNQEKEKELFDSLVL